MHLHDNLIYINLRLMSIIKKHWLGISMAILLGLISFLPNIIIEKKLAEEGLNYYPLTAAGYFDEMVFYAPFVKEVIEGNWISDDADFLEHQNTPSIFPILPPIILRLLFFFTNSVTQIFVWNDLLLPPISFFIIYLLIYNLSQNKIFSVFSAFFVVGVSITSDILPLEKLWRHGWNEFLSYSQPLFISRTYNYAVTFIGLALSLFFIHRLLKNQSLTNKIAAAITTGLLIHLNFFYGVYIGLSLLFLIAMFFWQKKYLEAKNIIFVLIVTAVMAIPYLIQGTLVQNYPHWPEVLLRQETDFGRHVYLNIYKHYLLYFALAGLLLFFGKKVKEMSTATLFTSLLLAGFIGLNLQVFLGYSVMPNHWLRTNVLGFKFAVLALILWLKELYPFIKKYFNALAGLGLAFFILVTVLNQVSYGINNYSLFTFPENLMESFRWLEKNTPKNSVVMTPSTITNHYLLVYTNNKVFMGSSYRSVVSNSELEERLLLTYKTFGISSEYLKEAFDPDQLIVNQGDTEKIPLKMGHLYTSSMIEYIYNNQYIDVSIDPHYKKPPFTSSLKERLAKSYGKTEIDLTKLKYKADYIYIGPLEKEFAHADFDKMPDLTKIYDKDNVQIYQITTKT